MRNAVVRLFGFLFVFALLGIVAPKAISQISCDSEAFSAAKLSARFVSVGQTKVLFLSGIIDGDAYSRVGSKIRQTGSYSEVWLCSPGGNVEAGKKIGRGFTSAKSTVRVPNGFRCVSACTIAHLGGYIRIIDKGANFVVHAMSAYLGNDFLEHPLVFDCRNVNERQVCASLSGLLENQNIQRCGTVRDFNNSSHSCRFYSDTSNVALKGKSFEQLKANKTLLLQLTDKMTDEQIGATIDLLEYYQSSLLDGRTNYINRTGYYKLRNNFKPVPLYASHNPTSHGRSLDGDLRLMSSAQNASDRVVVWQMVFTDAELNVMQQLVEFIKRESVDLGPAGDAATMILSAMITCQIQSTCYLEPHQAEALGYHNFFDAG